jgi:hypothetical protein
VIPAHRLAAAIVVGLVGLVVTGCAPTASTAPPPSPSPASIVPSSVPEPSESATASSPTGGCPVPPTTGALPSNALVGMAAETAGTLDRMTFSFADPVDMPTEPLGRLAATAPPFTHATTGDPVDVVGEHFLEIVFTGLAIADEEGNPTFQGQRDARYGLPAIKHAVIFDESEGQLGLILGYAGDGCVTRAEDPAARTVTIEIPHPAG